jgi:hypothetical protein
MITVPLWFQRNMRGEDLPGLQISGWIPACAGMTIRLKIVACFFCRPGLLQPAGTPGIVFRLAGA